MKLKGLHSGNKFEFSHSWHTHTQDKYHHAHKEQHLIPAGQKQKGEIQQFLQMFQAKTFFLRTNNTQIEK